MRMLLQESLENIPGVSKVYFQPPESTKLLYPCIIYELSDISSMGADDINYLNIFSFSLTVIDKDPESNIPHEILSISDPFVATFDRFFTTDNMNHWTFTLILRRLQSKED